MLVFKIDVWNLIDGKLSMRKTNITDVSNNTIEINGSKYKVMSALGQATSTSPGGHYKAILSVQGKWFHCSDINISQASWPRGSKGVYLLFYQAESAALPAKVETTEVRNERTQFTRQNTMPHAAQTTPTSPTNSHSAPTRVPRGSDTVTGETRYLDCIGFTNSDGVSCYANCILQSQLQHMPLQNAFSSSRYIALHSLSNNYMGRSTVTVVSSKQVRRMLGAPYCEIQQQDASEFLISLCMFCPQIKNCLEFTIRSHTRCTSCSYTSIRNDKDTLLPLTVPESCRSVTIGDLLTRMNTWETLSDSHCTTCGIDGAVYQTCNDIIAASELLVVQLKVYVFGRDGVIRKLRVSVNDVHSAITIQGHRYTVVSHGPSALSGHYTSYHRQERDWVLVNDTHLTRVLEPTTECDVFMLFYVREGS